MTLIMFKLTPCVHSWLVKPNTKSAGYIRNIHVRCDLVMKVNDRGVTLAPYLFSYPDLPLDRPETIIFNSLWID